jgi:5-methylcytosine-specific restriction endonuclease McrA
MKNPILVKASDELVLILDYCWMPMYITSVKEGIKKLYTFGAKGLKQPKVRAINKHGEPVCWEDWINSGNTNYYENQPFIKSTNQLIPVPTVLLTTSHFYYQARKMPKLSFLYKKYKGICQICGNQKPQNIMSLEHIYPKSFGGTLDWYNITLTCQPCNSKKGQIYPYPNYKGEELTGTPYTEIERIQYKVLKREEWGNFIFK